MSSANDQNPATRQSSDTAAQKCFICKYVIQEPCFCRIFRNDGAPILLCCPDCTVQYIDSTHVPSDPLEEELRSYEKKSDRLFVGENKPWS